MNFEEDWSSKIKIFFEALKALYDLEEEVNFPVNSPSGYQG